MPAPTDAGAAAAAGHPLRRLIRYARPFRRRTWLAVVCSVLNKIFDLAPPALIGAAVDVVVRGEDSWLAGFGLPDVRDQLVALSVVTAVVWLLESAFEYAYALLWRDLAQDVQHSLRLDAYGRLQELELAFFEERSTGGLMTVMGDDVNQLERFLNVGANDLLQVATTVLVIGGFFFATSPEVAWVAMAPMPFIVWGSIWYQRRLAPFYGEVREKASLINARLANNLGGITTIKSFTAERYELGQVRAESDAYRASNERAIRWSAAFVPLIRVIVLTGFTATLLVGGLQAVAGTLSVGAYSVLVFLTQRLLWPLTRLGDTLDLYQRAMASTRRVFALLDTPLEIHPGDRPLPVGQVRGEIAIERVDFAYRGREPVLRELSLHVPAGRTIAVVGATGSGKSTLVKLLLRLYEVEKGRITLDGHDIRTLRLDDLRRAVGLVGQDVFLFHGTVRENIAYARPDATAEQVEHAARIAEAHDFVMRLPQRYETVVGERGQKLSGGQRQRISIARAVLKDPPVLILDEATSAVDNETEAAIQRSLERITEHRTTLVIAHRLSTVRNADRIYVLDDGRLVEQGRHEELLQLDGTYAGLWRVQTGVVRRG